MVGHLDIRDCIFYKKSKDRCALGIELSPSMQMCIFNCITHTYYPYLYVYYFIDPSCQFN